MPRDTQTKMSNKNSKRKEETSRKKKRNEESSDDDDSSFYTDDDSENEMDVQEYRKFLNKIFPSKHLDNKIKAGKRLKKVVNDEEEEKDEDFEEDEDDDEDEDYKPKKKERSISKNVKKVYNTRRSSKKKQIVESVSEEELGSSDSEEELGSSDTEDDDTEEEYDSEEDDDESEEEYEYADEDDEDETTPKSSKFNIIFTIGGKGENEDASEEYDEVDEDETESGSNTENEDDSVSSESETDDEKKKEKGKKGKQGKKEKTSKEKNKKAVIKQNKKGNQTNEENPTEQDEILINKLKDVLGVNSSENTDTNNDVLIMLKELQSRNKNNDLVNECLKVCEAKMAVNNKKQEKKEKKVKARNGRIFKKILRDKNTMNDFEFYDKLETLQQKKIIKELREINKITRIEKPYRLTLLESDIPVIFKAAAMKKIGSLRYMEPGSGEFYKIKNWVDTFMRIPFSEYKTLPISISDGVDKCHNFMESAQKTLDEAVYGLNDAKMQIMQLLGQLITNPKAIGSAIAIHGPPGTGKTSLVKEGISKILNRPFAFIALGGATDSSFLEGHGYTYEGSTWGKIVQILIDSKCMNPVIYFDELDKISDTPKGEEIAGILTHLTDTSQNTQFHDKYFSEIDFDLSKCLFIFSYNDESKINPILKDRMYRIQTKGYNQKQKTSISNNYLLPKIREQVKFAIEDIIVPDQTLHYIIENHCNKEDGVRNLKRCLEIIYTKLNLYRLMRPGSNLFEEEMSIKVEFPFTVTKEMVDKLIKKTDTGLNPSLYHLYL